MLHGQSIVAGQTDGLMVLQSRARLAAAPDGWHAQHCGTVLLFAILHRAHRRVSCVGMPTALNSTMRSDVVSKPVVSTLKATSGRFSCRRPAACQSSGRFQTSRFRTATVLEVHRQGCMYGAGCRKLLEHRQRVASDTAQAHPGR